jgi:uncharacterized membrane protein
MQQNEQPQIHEPITESEKQALLVGGGLLVLLGLSRRSLFGTVVAGFGGTLLYRGLTGQSVASALGGANARQRNAPPWRRSERVQQTVLVSRPVEEVYRFWRNLDNLPRFMSHLERVLVLDGSRSRWTAKGPMDVPIEWDAEITDDVPNQRLAWRSLPGSQVQTQGSVSFIEAPGGQGTEIRVSFEYLPPAGQVGASVAKLLGEDPSTQVFEDLERLRSMAESGALPGVPETSEGYMG